MARCYMSSSLALKELSTHDCRVIKNMFVHLTAVTLEHILLICRGSRLTMRAFGMDALRFCMPQIFWYEMVLWPFQLSLVRRTSWSTTGEFHIFVRSGTAFAPTLTRTRCASDGNARVHQFPCLLHLRRKTTCYFQLQAIIAENNLPLKQQRIVT